MKQITGFICGVAIIGHQYGMAAFAALWCIDEIIRYRNAHDR